MAFKVVDDEIHFGETHFSRRKIQDFWGKFCEAYAKIEKRALRSKPQEFWQIVDQALADQCEKNSISVQIAWTIVDCSTELGLQTFKQEEQAAIDRLRVLSYHRSNAIAQ